MKLHRVPYTNQLARHQTPKPRGGDNLDHEARPNGIPLYQCKSSGWYPWQALRTSVEYADSGIADERKAWRCTDCGAEGDVERDSCCRCGSVLPLEYR